MIVIDRILRCFGYVPVDVARMSGEIGLIAGMLFVANGAEPSDEELHRAWRQWQADRRRARMVRENLTASTANDG